LLSLLSLIFAFSLFLPFPPPLSFSLFVLLSPLCVRLIPIFYLHFRSASRDLTGVHRG
jgi:hypothetical protein